MKRFLFCLLMVTVLLSIVLVPVYAADSDSSEVPAASEETAVSDSTPAKAVAAALSIGLAAAAGAIAMGMIVSKAVEGIARQPEAEGKIRSGLMVGLVFVETAIIYALVIAILIIFVL